MLLTLAVVHVNVISDYIITVIKGTAVMDFYFKLKLEGGDLSYPHYILPVRAIVMLHISVIWAEM